MARAAPATDAIRDAIIALSSSPWQFDPAPHVRRVRQRRDDSTATDPESKAEHKDPPSAAGLPAAEDGDDAPIRPAHEYDGQLPSSRGGTGLVWPRASHGDGSDEDEEGGGFADAVAQLGIDEYLLPEPKAVAGRASAGAWHHLFRGLLARYEEKEKTDYELSRIRDRDWYADSSLRENVSTSGSMRDRSIRQSLNKMGVLRSEPQVRFHNLLLQAAAKNVYRQDFDRCQEEIYARSGGATTLPSLVGVMWPRRFGKTTSVAMAAAALVAHVPGLRIGIFSTVQRTSKKLMEEVYRFLCMIPGARDRVCAKNKEELHVAPVAGSSGTRGARKRGGVTVNPVDVSIVYSYPASVTGTRGFTVHVIIIDEAAHIDPEVWKMSIVPALGTEGMVLLALTTAQSSTNFFSLLLEKKGADGTPLFDSLVLNLVCDACQLAGKQASCTHRNHMLPSWKPAGRQDVIRRILGDEDEKAYLQEAMNVVLEHDGSVFDKKHIDAFHSRPPYRPLNSPRFIYSFVDPHGGGAFSSQAIVSVYTDGVHVAVTTHPPARAHTNAQCT